MKHFNWFPLEGFLGDGRFIEFGRNEDTLHNDFSSNTIIRPKPLLLNFIKLWNFGEITVSLCAAFMLSDI